MLKKITLLVHLLLLTFPSNAQISRSYINQAFKSAAQKVGVSEELLRAVCWVESNHKSHAYRHSDSPTGHAFGMCQILYTTAKQFGLIDRNCLRDFDVLLPSERVYKACKLFGPKTNALFAAKILKHHLTKYNGNEYKAVLAYNAGRYVVCKDGWLYIHQVQEDGTFERTKWKRCLKGGPVNLYYANRVAHALEEER